MSDQPIAFEQVAVGEALIPLTVGPMTPLHLMRFSASIENWHRIHYDERFAVEHDGLPGLLISGSFKQHLVVQMLRAWAGPGSWLMRVGLQFRRMNVVGETLTAWGTITQREAREDFGVVTCEIGIRNHDGLESSPGTAVLAMPLTGGPALTAMAPRT
jgi:hydroxyacyl-ACP dehydratase HTD2-like protein with hotdog domain